MFKYTQILWIALSLVLSSNTLARSDIPLESGADFLINACREVVDIYDARGKEKLLAAQRTSLAEGIRTGYCIGVIAQYREHADYCRYSKRNVLEMAQAIANSNLTASQLLRTSMSDLLEEAYCGL